MSYTSLVFLLFVVLLVILYYIIPKKYRWIVLLLGSLYFFYSLSKGLIIYNIIATIVTFFFGKLIHKKENKKLYLLLGIIIVLLFLIVLKYNNFIIDIINIIPPLKIPHSKILMPIGISYYTLEMISYLTDIYRKKIEPEKNFFKLLTFFSYFPKLVEGPISKYRDYKEKMFEGHQFNYDKFVSAWVLIGYGFIQKLVIADRVGPYVDKLFSSNQGGMYVVMAAILYTIQLYMDFAGCINIVSGISELFGIDLPKNFNRPFFSQTIDEFWRRWHITLGEWLKEYVFYPISLSKMNMKLNMKLRKSKYKHLSRFIIVAFPLFFVWFTNGLWHGVGFKYICYGLYYYILMMLGVLLKPLLDKIIKVLNINTKVFSYKLFRIFRTTVIVCIGMLLFRSDSLSHFFQLLASLTTPAFITISQIPKKDTCLIIFYLFIVVVVGILEENKINLREKLQEQNLLFRWIIYWIIIFSVIIFGMYGRGFEASSFIYGGF